MRQTGLRAGVGSARIHLLHEVKPFHGRGQSAGQADRAGVVYQDINPAKGRDGLLNGVVSAAGGTPTLWLAEPGTAFFWVVFVSIWAHMGFYTLILLAGLQAIPADLYEAAQLDRASPWRTLVRITLPMLMPNLLVVLVLAALCPSMKTLPSKAVLLG